MPGEIRDAAASCTPASPEPDMSQGWRSQYRRPVVRSRQWLEHRGACKLGDMLVVKLSELLGQPGASTFLRGVVAGGRFANAYLFHGPSGVGKGTAALAFA